MASETAVAAILEHDYIDGRTKEMPWSSTAQQRWGHSPRGLAALGGMAGVHKWDEATKKKKGGFKSLPAKVGHRKHSAPPRYMGQTSGPGE